MTNPVSKITFHTPVIFNKELLAKKKPVEKWLIGIGAWADCYAYSGKEYFNASTQEHLPLEKRKTALKIITCIASVFTLLIFALIAKALYKNWAKHVEIDLIKIEHKAKETKKKEPKEIKPKEIKIQKEEPIAPIPLKKEPTQANLKLAVVGLEIPPTPEEAKKAVYEHLEALSNPMSEGEKLRHLFELEKLNKFIDESKIDEEKKTLMVQILKKDTALPQAKDLKDLIMEEEEDKLKYVGKPRKTRELPDQWLELSTFIEKMMHKVFKKNCYRSQLLNFKGANLQQKARISETAADYKLRFPRGERILGRTDTGNRVFQVNQIELMEVQVKKTELQGVQNPFYQKNLPQKNKAKNEPEIEQPLQKENENPEQKKNDQEENKFGTSIINNIDVKDEKELYGAGAGVLKHEEKEKPAEKEEVNHGSINIAQKIVPVDLPWLKKGYGK